MAVMHAPLNHGSRHLGLFDGCEAIVAIVVLLDLEVGVVAIALRKVLLQQKDGRFFDLRRDSDRRGHGGAIEVMGGCKSLLQPYRASWPLLYSRRDIVS